MNRLPNPFEEEDQFGVQDSPKSDSPCGFLALTRPSSEINYNSEYRSQNYMSTFQGKLQNNSSNRNMSRPFSHNFIGNRGRHLAPGYSPYRSPSNYDNPMYNTPPQHDRSPNMRHNAPRNQSPFNSPRFHSTPSSSRGNFNKNWMNKNNSFNQSGKNSPHKTPLKDIPIDKFVSANMMKDPWENFK